MADWDPTWVVTSHHVPDMSPTIWSPWQLPLPSNGALYIQQLWASGGRTRESILMKFGTQQQISPPWYGCHGNGRCLPTAHWTFCSYGRLESERVNQFRWYSEHNSMLGPQRQSHDQILKFLKFKRADGRHVGKYWKYHNSPGTKLGWGHPITFPSRSRHVPQNGVAMATAVA